MNMRTLVCLMALACNPTTTQTVTSITAFCVEGDTVTALFAGCLSSSCDTLDAVSCSVDGVRISGEATISSQGNECTDDCGLITAECSAAGATDLTIADPPDGARGRVPSCDDLL